MQSKTEMRILFVDDEPVLTEIFEIYFAMHGFKIETAHSGSDGLEKAREFCPDVIVSDLHMANGSGAFLFESLLNEGILPKKFIICSGNHGDYPNTAGIPQPPMILPKPIAGSHLLDTITSIATTSSNCSNSSVLETRKRVRFKPDPSFHALIQFRVNATQRAPGKPVKFESDCSAQIIDYSPFGGAGLIVHQNIELKQGDLCVVKIGPLAPVHARIAHLTNLNDSLLRIGCSFLE